MSAGANMAITYRKTFESTSAVHGEILEAAAAAEEEEEEEEV